MAERDIEREEEVSRQRGYGEEFRNGKGLENQDTDGAGYKKGSPVAQQGGEPDDLVTTMDDERVPNAPNDGTDDDSSATIEGHASLKKKPDGHLLEDAYSVPDPGVEPKE